MATIPKLIKAALDFSKVLPEQLLAQGFAVLNGLIGNANFTNVPVDLALLKTALDAYSVAIAEARDGSKKAIALRNRQGEEVIRMLRALANYVELHCKDDMNAFLSSGFQPRSGTRKPAQPLDQPVIVFRADRFRLCCCGRRPLISGMHITTYGSNTARSGMS